MLLEHVYRNYFNRGRITPKEMAHLICDKDPNDDNKLTDSNSKFKNTKQRIYDAVKNEKIPFSGQYSVNKPIDSKILFHWSASTYKDFGRKLPVDLIVCSGSADISLLSLGVDATGINDIPQSYKELLFEYRKLTIENQEKDQKILSLSDEVERLSYLEKKSIAKKSDSAKGGRNSKGKNKIYK